MQFDKYHACGNDFIVLNHLSLSTVLTPALVQKLCHRQFGIGADGVVVLKNWDEKNKKLKIDLYNSDGGITSMCANGTRCAVDKISELFNISGDVTLQTMSGDYQCNITAGDVWLSMPNHLIRSEKIDITKVPLDFKFEHFGFANTGVPHSVFFVNNVTNINLMTVAPKIRNHSIFKDGCNVNFVAIDKDKNTYQVRTYERGVEAETLSCGTGILAIASILKNSFQLKGEIIFNTPGGILKAKIADNAIAYGGKVNKTFSGSTVISL